MPDSEIALVLLLNILQEDTGYFDARIIFALLVFQMFTFFLSVFSSHSLK